MIFLLTLASLLFPFPCLICIITFYCRYRKPVVCAVLCAIAMLAISLGVANNDGVGDLSTYTRHSMNMAYGSYIDAINYSSNTQFHNNYLAIFWFWIVSKTGNYRLIPAVVALIEYGILYFIIFDYANVNRLSSSKVLLSVIFLNCLVAYYLSLSSVRSAPALAICTLSMYLNRYKNEPIHTSAALYLLALELHTGSVAILALHLASYAIKDNFGIGFIAALIAIPVAYRFSAYIAPIASKFGLTFFSRMQRYVEYDDHGWAEIISKSRMYRILKYIHIAFACLLMYVSIKTKNYIKGNNRVEDSQLITMGCISYGLVIDIALSFTVTSYLRYSYALYPMLILPIVKYGYNEENERSRSYRVYNIMCYMIIFLSIVIMSFYLRALLRGMAIKPFLWHLMLGCLADYV